MRFGLIDLGMSIDLACRLTWAYPAPAGKKPRAPLASERDQKYPVVLRIASDDQEAPSLWGGLFPMPRENRLILLAGMLAAFGAAAYAGQVLLHGSPLEAVLLGAVAALGLGLAALLATLWRGEAAARRERDAFAAGLQAAGQRQNETEKRLALLIEHARRVAEEPRPASAIDVEATGTLLRELAELVSGQEMVLSALEQRVAVLEGGADAAAPAFPEPPRAFTPPPQAPSRPAPELASRPARIERMADAMPRPQPAAVPASNLRLVKDLILADALELALQPIVSLPQRKTRAYQAILRPAETSGQALSALDLRNGALAAGLAARFDRAAISRTIALVRVFRQRSREATVMATLTPAGLADAEVSSSLRRLVAEEPDLAAALVLMLPQAALRNLGAIEAAMLDEIVRGGIRIGVCEADDLRFNAEELFARGVRFIKTSAARLIEAGQSSAQPLEIHAADLGGFLARHGISLIADGIAAEQTVLDLLDFVVPLAEGDLFSTPRPVRPEILGQVTLAPAAPAAESQAPQRTPFRSLLRRASV
jgi:cyclic-di-GMP phosphodiesterase TipF (flagellum assembly factor)